MLDHPRPLTRPALASLLVVVAVACTPPGHGDAAQPSTTLDPGASLIGTSTCVAAGPSFCWMSPAHGGTTLTGAWLAPDGQGWVADASGALQRWDGSALRPVSTPGGVTAVWGSGANDVWAVGEAVLHFDGTSWAAADAPPGGPWSAVHGTSPADVWAVGAAGAIARFDGHAWTRVPSPTAEDLSSVAAAAPDEAYAASAVSGSVLRWDGVAWSTAARLASRSVSALLATGPGDVWAAAAPLDVNAAAGARGTALAHLVGGSWQSVVTPGLESARYTALAATSPLDVWAFAEDGAGAGAAVHLGAGAGTPERLPGATLPPRAAGASAGLVLAVGDGGQVLAQRGGSWDVVQQGLDGYLQAAAATASGAVWFSSVRGGSSRQLLRVASETVTAVPVGVDDVLYGIWASADDDVWVGTLHSGFLHFDGRSWTAGVGGYTGLVDGVRAFGPGDVWGVAGAVALHFDGRAVRQFPLPGGGARRLLGLSPTDLWAVGGTGVVQRWDGNAWSAVPVPGGGTVLAAWGAAPDDVWMVGVDGLALHWDGRILSPLPTGTRATLWGVTGSPAQGVWAVGAGGTLLRAAGLGFAAVPSGTTNALAAATTSSTGAVYVGGEFGTILRLAR